MICTWCKLYHKYDFVNVFFEKSEKKSKKKSEIPEKCFPALLPGSFSDILQRRFVQMQITECSFAGIPECLKLSEGKIELIVTLSVGPRIISCTLDGGENFFRVFDNAATADPGKWNIYGGHRLWIAPEIPERTKVPDNRRVKWTKLSENSVCFEAAEEPENRIVKRICISFEEGKVRLDHTIINNDLWAKDLSVWSLSVMAPGTTAVIPQEEFLGHGTGPGKSLLPVRSLALWGYTDMTDTRFTWGKKSIQLREEGGAEGVPAKIGVLNKRNFAAAFNAGGCMVKRFDFIPGGEYPDMGCNWEFYTIPGMLEVETLSPMYRVEPGCAVSSSEVWELYKEIPAFVKELM